MIEDVRVKSICSYELEGLLESIERAVNVHYLMFARLFARSLYWC